MHADTSEITEALAFIPADDRDVWVRAAMAIKSLMGDDGRALWDEWSRSSDSYDEADARDVWKSITPDGGVTIASLFAIAKEHGYHPRHNGHEGPRTPDAVWDAGTTDGVDQHPYLAAKGVNGHGLRRHNGTLLVPVLDGAGHMLSVQRIFRKDNQWQKRFCKDARLGCGFHQIGEPGDGPIIMAEGYATAASVHEATGYAVIVAFDCGRLATVGQAIRAMHPQRVIVIAADDDAHVPGNPGTAKATAAAKTIGAKVVVPAFAAGGGGDFNDLAQAEGGDVVRRQIEAALLGDDDSGAAQPPRLVSVTIHDLLSRDLPKIEPLLSPWLGKQSLNMVYAWRGVGKTHFALNLAYAVASGGEFLGWEAPEPNGVLYLDGEMPGGAMQERLSAIVMAHQAECDPERFRIITPDLQSAFMPDLATASGQADIEAHIRDDTRLIIVDNLSALVRRGGRENDAESWLSVGEWAMFQRSRGRSVLFVHHAGKDGRQRGTSKREDILDAVVCLSRPADYDPAKEGARFVVEFQKDRHRSGATPFEAKLDTDQHGGQVWTTRTVESSRLDQIIELAQLGLNIPDIASELGVNKSTVSRALRKAEADGLYSPPKKGRAKAKVVDIRTRERRDVDD